LSSYEAAEQLNFLECGGSDAALDIDSRLEECWKIKSMQSGVAAAALLNFASFAESESFSAAATADKSAI